MYGLRDELPDLAKITGLNGTVIAFLSLTEVREVVAIILGVVTIISTLIIIRKNLRNQKDHD